MREIGYFYPNDRQQRGHIVWMPYGSLATTLCKLRISTTTMNPEGKFVTEKREPQSLCRNCRRRLTRLRTDEQKKLVRDMELLKKWDPRHPYLGEEEGR